MVNSRILQVLSSAVVAALCIGSAVAQDLPQVHLKIVGGLGNVSQYRNFEEPFWTRTVRERSGGRVTAEISPSDSVGLRQVEILQLMRLGVIPFGTASLSAIATEDAEAAGLDLAGLNPDISSLRKHIAAYRETLVKLYRERYNVEVLSIYTYPAQVAFCNTPIQSLRDLSGKRVRVASVTHGDLIDGLGGRAVNLPFNQMIDALRRRAVDCAITGTLSGNSVRIFEVANHVYALPISWGPNILSVNLKFWEGLPEPVRQFLRHNLAELEDQIWANAERETLEGLNCNTGRGECTLGVRANMTLVPVRADDDVLLKRILREVILPRWADRCGDECAETWNATIGRLSGLQAPVN